MSATIGKVRSWPRWVRVVAIGAAVAILLAAAFGIAYRVLRPAEVHSITVSAGVSPDSAEPFPHVIGGFYAAPLIVDGRVRVYAGERQLRADGPTGARTERTPYWAFRRWPERLVGVAATGSVVIGRWSDGELVAIDGVTGQLAWRAAGPAPTSEPVRRRTGDQVLYAPPELFTVTASDGRAVVLVAGAAGVRSYDAQTGAARWESSEPCGGTSFTTTSGHLACPGPSGIDLYDVTSGRRGSRWQPPAGDSSTVTGVSCRVGASECPAFRVGGQGYRLEGGRPVATPTLDDPGAWVVRTGRALAQGSSGGEVAQGSSGGEVAQGSSGQVAQGREVAITATGAGEVVARSVLTGAELWRWRAPSGDTGVQVIAVQPAADGPPADAAAGDEPGDGGRVHVLTAERRLVTLDATTGETRSRFVLTRGRQQLTYQLGPVHAAGGFVAVVRLKRDATGSEEDRDYFFTIETVLLAAT